MSNDMSNLPEVYNGPEYNPHNVDPASRAPEIAQQGGYSGKVDPHQSLPPYKDEYGPPNMQQQQQAPLSPWTPPPQGYTQQQQQQQPFMPPQQQFIPPQQQPQLQSAAKRNTICGMRKVAFWIVVAVLFVIIIGAGVGAGVGISMKKKNNWKPYDLTTGAWNINNVPLSQHNGICTNDYAGSAVAGCGPLNFPFIINRVGDNFQISSSPYAEMNGLLSQPLGEGDMYQKSFYSSGQPSAVDSPCASAANVTVKLGKSYQYEISNEHTTQLACQLNSGVLTTPNQKCNCYWFGTLNQ